MVIQKHSDNLTKAAVFSGLINGIVNGIINWFQVKDKPSYFPGVFLLTLKNAFFTFGILTTLSILLQRVAGSISVTSVTAAFIVAMIAALVAGTIDYMTKKELLRR